MRSLIRLSDYSKSEIKEIFAIADKLQEGEYQNFLKGKTVVIFFPESSIRTRVTFEKGIYSLGGQSILFPPSTLDKKEKTEDVIGYLNNWVDAIIVRHKDISMIEEMVKYTKFPIINAMTDINHPCEMLADLYSLSKIREDFTNDKYLFVGASGNIGKAWKEAADVMGFSLTQSCPVGYEIGNTNVVRNLQEAVIEKDIICTDSLGTNMLEDFYDYQVTLELMKLANSNALVNPCPPFYRGEEVSKDVIDSEYFVGYEFKKYLLEIQQAIVIFNLLN